ncbi:uncharacterized protein LOC131956588 [Physella acuta]|uniref:uncharacterized protein LOC131956588 n=1 Tax=Physella acuta TaxID=109671 RepID=UPI0027DCA7B4|nr:uncharacterized protein LOC131956588 [Physella acuta]
MPWLKKHIRPMAAKLRSPRKYFSNNFWKRSVLLPIMLVLFMICSFGMISSLPHTRDTYIPFEHTKTYLLKVKNEAPFPVWVDVVESVADPTGPTREIGQDGNILQMMEHDEVNDLQPGDFDYRAADAQRSEFNLRYDDVVADKEGKPRSENFPKNENNLNEGDVKNRIYFRNKRSGAKNRNLNNMNLKRRNKLRNFVVQANTTGRLWRSLRQEGNTKNRQFFSNYITTIVVHVDRTENPGRNNVNSNNNIIDSNNNDGGLSQDKAKKHMGFVKNTNSEVEPGSKNINIENVQRKFNNSIAHPQTPVPEAPRFKPARTRREAGSEVHDVVFLKVHKAASTTVYNIFMRFAISRQLDVMLPKNSNIITETGSIIKPEVLLPYPQDLKFNLVCSHLVYNRAQISKYLKSPDRTVYIGIVREPFEQFVSAFNYYLNTHKRPLLVQIALDHPRNPIRGFLENPLKYADVPKYDYGVTYINNRMSADFGFPMWNLENDKHREDFVRKFVKVTEENFDLVMVVDMFEESLVLMRRMLRWRVKDVLYLRANTRTEAMREQTLHLPWKTNVKFNEDDVKNHKLYSPVDHALYDHFKALLVKEVQNQPPDFAGEVEMLKVILKDVASFCENVASEPERFRESELRVPDSQWSESFTVENEDCKLLATDELEMLDLVRNKQKERHAGSLL